MSENFYIHYSFKSKGQVKLGTMRMDDSQGEAAMRDRFKRMYPRRTIVTVEDITTLVKAGCHCY